ncbi:MAG: LytTR family DNA-binding domain-containing protein [Oscillospiraceae bacterium]|nr:LytTR family DNA-binding domain-containing protein [Oscillospiraceae bacterium]
MKIAVCDDEKNFREDVSAAIYEYSNKHRHEMVVNGYVCGEDLLNSVSKYDIIMLDYHMDGISGLEVAREIRKKNILSEIIFMTNHPGFVYEAFEVNAFRFFEKPLNVKKIHKAFDDYFSAFGNNYPIPIKIERETICVNTRDIVYIEADNKKCHVNLIDKAYPCTNAMRNIIKFLPKNIFYRVHKSFVVNFNYISSYNNQDIKLKNGATARVSRKYFASFRDAYHAFVKGRII